MARKKLRRGDVVADKERVGIIESRDHSRITVMFPGDNVVYYYTRSAWSATKGELKVPHAGRLSRLSGVKERSARVFLAMAGVEVVGA